jgi:hypothetical protein
VLLCTPGAALCRPVAALPWPSVAPIYTTLALISNHPALPLIGVHRPSHAVLRLRHSQTSAGMANNNVDDQVCLQCDFVDRSQW